MKRSHPTTPRRRATVTPSEKPLAPLEPSGDAIARRAYELYQARGCADGCDLDDWLQAEHELRASATGRITAD